MIPLKLCHSVDDISRLKLSDWMKSISLPWSRPSGELTQMFALKLGPPYSPVTFDTEKP